MIDFCLTSEFVNNSSPVFTIPVKHVKYVVCQSCMHVLIIQRNITTVTMQWTWIKKLSYFPCTTAGKCRLFGLIKYSRPIPSGTESIFIDQAKQVIPAYALFAYRINFDRGLLRNVWLENRTEQTSTLRMTFDLSHVKFHQKKLFVLFTNWNYRTV